MDLLPFPASQNKLALSPLLAAVHTLARRSWCTARGRMLYLSFETPQASWSYSFTSNHISVIRSLEWLWLSYDETGQALRHGVLVCVRYLACRMQA